MTRKFLSFFVLIILSTEILADNSVSIVISEIAWMGTVSSYTDEWIELYNSTDQDINITGWYLRADDGTPDIELSGTIPAQDYFLLERTDDTTTSLTANQIYTGGLGNDGELLRLLDSSNQEIDRTPEGDWIAGNNEEKRTMIRSVPIQSGAETDSWETYEGEGGDVLDSEGNVILGTPQASNMEEENEEKTPPQIEILISEISPSRRDPQPSIDFIELFVLSGPAEINLINLEVKRKTSPRTIIKVEQDFIVEVGDFIVLNFNDSEISQITSNNNPHQISVSSGGLSTGSETLEVILHADTQWEISSDFVCYQAGDISQGVREARDNAIEQGIWQGDCLDIDDLIHNESLARTEPQSDSNTLGDFFRHFNGSIGVANNPQNSPPATKFIVQGGARIYTTSLNLTGLDGTSLTTTDPDGEHDLLSWQWLINNQSCSNYELDGWEWGKVRSGNSTCVEESTRSNPDRIYFNFDQFPTFQVSLTATDYSGSSNTYTENVDRDPFNIGGGGGSAPNAFTPALKKWLTKELNAEPKQKELAAIQQISQRKNKVSLDFFTEFLAHADLNNLPPVNNSSSTPKLPLFQKERFTKEDKKYLAKNIGLVFDF